MRRLRKILFVFILLFGYNIVSYGDNTQRSLSTQEQRFVDALVKKDHFDRQKTTQIFQQFTENKEIIGKMNAPFEKATWSSYQALFVTDKRVNNGALYWYQHHDALTNIEKKYGIPASIIIAIIGVETAYGKHLGTYGIANTLYTLAFYYPKRANYFKKELREFFLLARENHFPLMKMQGSYAGAIGIPQFMPSSYRNYGVSGSNQPVVDLFHKQTDAIASVANYLAKNGWTPNGPIAKKATDFNEDYRNSQLISFKEENGSVTWRLFHNFDVILRYNHSPSYAMVVYQLANAIQKKYVTLTHQNKSNPTASTRSIGLS